MRPPWSKPDSRLRLSGHADAAGALRGLRGGGMLIVVGVLLQIFLHGSKSLLRSGDIAQRQVLPQRAEILGDCAALPGALRAFLMMAMVVMVVMMPACLLNILFYAGVRLLCLRKIPRLKRLRQCVEVCCALISCVLRPTKQILREGGKVCLCLANTVLTFSVPL